MVPNKFTEIAPFEDAEFESKMSELVKEPGFEHAVRYVMPDVDYTEFASELLKVSTKHDFQRSIMVPFLEMLVKKTTSGVSGIGFEHINNDISYTYISNHRDIVLDASFLNLCLVRTHHHTSEIALGNNLLIYNWIETLVKLNKSFIVKRNLKHVKALEAAIQLSSYMHYCINDKHESTWIAQREGRAKDSNDLTQESLVKMLTLGGKGSPAERLKSLNITPVSISYEYDPCDYLKATEYLNRRRNPDYQKTEHDDLVSMETGILGYKGRVIFTIRGCINDQLNQLDINSDRQTCIHTVAGTIDNYIHRGYYIFPCNYIAYDRVENCTRFADKYTITDVDKFDAYIARQLNKVNLPDITPDEYDYMRDMIQQMYANPLRNKLKAENL